MKPTEVTIKIIRPSASDLVDAKKHYEWMQDRAIFLASSQIGRGVKYLRIRRVHNNGDEYRFKVGIVGR